MEKLIFTPHNKEFIELNYKKYDKDKMSDDIPTINIKNVTFVDIFNFIDIYYMYETKWGTTFMFYKDKKNIIVDMVNENNIKKGDGGYGTPVEEFDMENEDYFIAMRNPGGYYCYKIMGNPYL